VHCKWYKGISVAINGQLLIAAIKQRKSDFHVADRRRRKNPKRERLFLRLTTKQLELLRKYVDYRDFESEAAGVRAMIDGLEDWFLRQEAKSSAPAETTSSPEAQANSGLRHDTDVEPTDGEPTDGESSVDFAGRWAPGRMPESRHDGNE